MKTLNTVAPHAFARVGLIAVPVVVAILLTALLPPAPVDAPIAATVAIGVLADDVDMAPRVVKPIIFRRPEAAPAAAPPPLRQVGIMATVFAGGRRRERSAYRGFVSSRAHGCALPFRFAGDRPRLRLHRRGRVAVCQIVDVGPWLIDDPYWMAPGRRPAAEQLHRDRQPAFRGRVPTQGAGIDVTPAIARVLGLRGRGLVDWEFVE